MAFVGLLMLVGGVGALSAVGGDPHDHCWHLGCIPPKVPAIIVRTGAADDEEEGEEEEKQRLLGPGPEQGSINVASPRKGKGVFVRGTPPLLSLPSGPHSPQDDSDHAAIWVAFFSRWPPQRYSDD